MARYIVMARRKYSDVTSGEPMSYGREDEPQPNYLLLRDRATIFKTLLDAGNAIDASIKEARRLNHPWPDLYRFNFLECEDA